MNGSIFSWRSLATLTALALAANALNALNDGIFWDGWLIYRAFTSGHPELFRLALEESGLPQVYWLHWLVWQSPNPIWLYKTAGFIALSAATPLAYLAMCLTRVISARTAVIAAAVMAVCSSFQVGFELIMFQYVVCYCLFWAATCLMVWSTPLEGPGRPAARVASLVLFFASFTIESLLVFYAVPCLWLLYRGLKQSQSLMPAVALTVRRHPDYLVLPPLYWVLTRTLLPRTGMYAEYNKVAFSPRQTVSRLVRHLWHSTGSQLLEAADAARHHPLVLLVATCVVAAALAALFVKVAEREQPHAAPGRSTWWPLAFAAFCLLVAAAPYALVGKPAGSHGWESRHAMLMPFGIGWAVAAVLGWSAPFRWPRAAAALAAGLPMVAFVTNDVVHQLGWLARWAKDREIISELATPGFADISVLWVEDRTDSSEEPHYRFYEWACLFAAATGDEKRVGLDQSELSAEELAEKLGRFNQRRCLGDFEVRGGAHARLRIGTAPDAPPELARGLAYAGRRLSGQTTAPLATTPTWFTFELTKIEPPVAWQQAVEAHQSSSQVELPAATR